MRKRATMCLRGKKELLNNIYEKIRNDAVKAEVVADMLPITIYQDTDGYKLLMDEIDNNSVTYTFAEGREYTKNEINSAKYFHCEIMYPWEHDPKNAEDYGTKYNHSNVCDKCGLGKEQVSDLVIDTIKMGKYQFAQIIPEFIITEKTKQIIIQNDLSGCEFRPIKDFKGREGHGFYQLIITNILPSMSNDVRFEILEGIYCSECDANGKYLRSEVVYKLTDLINAKDFNLTSEFIGQANYLGRHLIVSAKVRDVLSKSKIKSIAYEPIRIV